VTIYVAVEPADSPSASALIAALDQYFDEQYGEVASNALDPPSTIFFVARIDSAPVGSVAYRQFDHDASSAEVKRTYVTPEARGQGVGIALLDTVVVHAGAAGFTRLVLALGSRQPEAMHRYLAYGFTHLDPYAPYDDGVSTCLQFALDPIPTPVLDGRVGG
jgi:GNAT superfamily N-acetyltransferase